MTEQTVPAGHIFFRPGDPADQAYLLSDGLVEILGTADQTEQRIALIGAGEVFGEMALIEERPRSLTARAVKASRVLPMTREEFEHHLSHDPGRARQYLRSLFERLRTLTAQRDAQAPTPQAVSRQPVEASVASGAVDFAPGAGRATDWVVEIHPLTRRAAETLPDLGLRVTRFPLRIGRVTGAHEREALDLNDLWLMDEKPFSISRNHCEIDVGHYGPIVRDRGSHLGCRVNDEPIGGRAAIDYARLLKGDNVLVIGGAMSPYQFRVVVAQSSHKV